MAPQPQKVNIADLDAGKILSGPYFLFDKSFELTFIEPPQDLDATVLMRVTYLDPLTHPLCRAGRAHPQSPPLHLHFDQLESFVVARGEVCTREGWDVKEVTWKPEDGVQVVDVWVPHSFHPSPTAPTDSTIYLWAHPTSVPEPMDRLFFQTLLRHLSDAHDQRKPPSLLQMMTTQHDSATALIIFPTATWLGPLRWWVPWQLQRGVAAIGRACGYYSVQREYASDEDWEGYLHAKKA